MHDFLGWWQGRVQCRAEGDHPEAFLNRCYRKRIRIISPRREDTDQLVFTVPASSFRRLRDPAFKSGSRIKILKKRGLFCWLRRYGKRWGLVAGLIIFLSLIFYSSSFIWDIRVIGCADTSEVQIRQDLEELGLKIGARRSIDVNKLENRYLTGNDKLIWMSVNIRGTTAYIEVKEKGIKPTLIDDAIPTNIYASRDGRIVSVIDYRGERQKQVGDTVRAGDLLVSGDWTDSYGIRRLSHCIASVRAETVRKTTVKIPLSDKILKKTGKKAHYSSFFFGKKKVSLYFKKKITYNKYSAVTNVYPLRIGSFALPIRLRKETVYEVSEETVRRSAEEARILAAAKLGFFEGDVLSSVKILQREVQETLSQDALELSAEYICEEEIGIPIAIKE